MLSELLKGLHLTLGNGESIAYLVGASIFGMVTGVLPGLGGPVVLSVVLALIYHISLTGVLCVFLAVQAASFFTSSITAILLNTPSHAESFAVTFDGFPMAQRGEAGRALGISAASTCIGGLIGCACLIGFIQIINFLPTLFHPPEYVALITTALILVATLGTDSAAKALISVGIGIVIASIGQDPVTGAFRLTFGTVGLFGGVLLVSLALGLFAIPQMVLLFGVADRVARQDMTGREIGRVAPAQIGQNFAKQVVDGVLETFRHWFVCLRAALVGVLTGLVPGIGAFAANFMSYGLARQSSKNRAKFGTGIAEGIIAPEGSSLSKEAGGLVPLLGLGIPGGVGSALFLSALTIKGIKVGYGFTTTYPSIAYEMVWIIAFGGVLGTLIGVMAAPWLAKVTLIPGPALVPVIMSLAVVGAFVAGNSFFAIMELAAFALLGFFLRRLRYAIAALVVALVLGQEYETNISLTHALFPGVSFLRRPSTDILFAIAFGILALKVVQETRDHRLAKRALEELDPNDRVAAIARNERQTHPYPVLSLVVTSTIGALAIAVVVYSMMNYSFIAASMPVIGGVLAAVGSIVRFPGDLQAYRHYWRDRNRRVPADLPMASERVRVERHEADRMFANVASGVLTVLDAGDVGLEVDDAELSPDLERERSAVDESEFPAIVEKAWGRNGQYTREVIGFAWFGVLIGFCYLVGFYVAVPAFSLLYGLLGTRRSIRSVHGRLVFGIAVGAGGWAATYAIFQLLHLSYTPILQL